MDSAFLSSCVHPTSNAQVLCGLGPCSRYTIIRNSSIMCRITLMVQIKGSNNGRKLPKNLRYPRRTKLPPDIGTEAFWKRKTLGEPSLPPYLIQDEATDSIAENPVIGNYEDTKIDDNAEEQKEEDNNDNIVWNKDEIEVISSLFRGRIPQKPGTLNRRRALPLSLPYKIRPWGLPTPKKYGKSATSREISLRQPLHKQVYKNPAFLIELAKKIRSLPPEEDVAKVLNKWSHFLRKGSLSLTIRELGHMGLPKRALETFCWAQKQPQLFPDDRILASTVEVLARSHELKLPFDLCKFTSLANRNVIEAMVKGFIKGGSLGLAWKLLYIAKDNNRMLDTSIYSKLILQLGKNPDKETMVLALLEELGEREVLNLNQQDCTAIMKVCIRLGKFEVVESLFTWFKQSGHAPGVVMYTTLIFSRYSEKKYREALALVWELESSDFLFDLPAYRVIIKVFVALNDLKRAVRYFSKLKEAGFSPTYDIFRDLFTVYMVSGRMAKCKDICKEAEMRGFVLDKQVRSQLQQIQR